MRVRNLPYAEGGSSPAGSSNTSHCTAVARLSLGRFFMNSTRLESRLAPSEADMEAAEVRGPRRFRTLLGKTSASPT